MTRKKADGQIECCVLFTEALHSKGSFELGFGVPMKKGETWTTMYVFCIPAKGRGAARKTARNLVLNHCPFCGAPPKAGEKPETRPEDP